MAYVLSGWWSQAARAFVCLFDVVALFLFFSLQTFAPEFKLPALGPSSGVARTAEAQCGQEEAWRNKRVMRYFLFSATSLCVAQLLLRQSGEVAFVLPILTVVHALPYAWLWLS